MRMKLAALTLDVVPAVSFAQNFDEPRNATVPASGATLLNVDARAGQLRITGRTDLTEVRYGERRARPSAACSPTSRWRRFG